MSIRFATVALTALIAVPLGAADRAARSQSTAWAPQMLSGTITMVDPAHRLVVVRSSDGVPYDLDVTTHTKIRSGELSIDWSGLSGNVNKSVSVKFVPERKGDIATFIRIGG